MSKPEDRTFNSIRALSDKRATECQGSIVTMGGIYVDKNIECAQDIVTEDLVVKGLTKLAGDVSIGGTLYCPDWFSVDNNNCRFRRNLIPAIPIGPPNSCGPCSLGTLTEPWDLCYAQDIKAASIDTQTFLVGPNAFDRPSMRVDPTRINISHELNIINPQTNTIMLKSGCGFMETYVPVYQQWDSVKAMELAYNPEQTLCISTSTILLNILDANELHLSYETDMVPDSTKIKIYFVRQNVTARAAYRLELSRFDKRYVFCSTGPVKKIKLFFIGSSVYLF